MTIHDEYFGGRFRESETTGRMNAWDVLGLIIMVVIVLAIAGPHCFARYYIAPDDLRESKRLLALWSKGRSRRLFKEKFGWEHLRQGVVMGPGRIHGVLKCARGLPNTDAICGFGCGKSDPYTVLKVTEDIHTSCTIDDTLDPVWNEAFVLRSENPREDVLEVRYCTPKNACTSIHVVPISKPGTKQHK